MSATRFSISSHFPPPSLRTPPKLGTNPCQRELRESAASAAASRSPRPSSCSFLTSTGPAKRTPSAWPPAWASDS